MKRKGVVVTSESADQGPQVSAEASRAERKRRRRLLLLTLVLMLGLPLYLLSASFVMAWITAPIPGEDGSLQQPVHWSLQLLIYIVLGMIWVFPLKGLATGVGRGDRQPKR